MSPAIQVASNVLNVIKCVRICALASTHKKKVTDGNVYLTSSLVDLSWRWLGDEVRRSGRTELGREPGDESDRWKSPPLPPPLCRSPPSRFCKVIHRHLKRLLLRHTDSTQKKLGRFTKASRPELLSRMININYDF